MKLLSTTIAACLLTVLAQNLGAEEKKKLRIIGEETRFVVNTASGPLEITRVMTPCAKNEGWLQALIPEKGTHPVTEIEILQALNDKDALVVDMRVIDDRLKGTIPNSISMPYTEVSMRLNELGCSKAASKWDCSNAKKVYAFCNGPVCPQSPIAMSAMIRDGFPADKIYYYRGGMLDWEALGLTTIRGEF